jgi:hypothetical protein
MNVFAGFLLLLAVFSVASALASTVHRCESPNGAVTFTDLGCTEDAMMSFQQAYNPPPGGGQAGLLPEREWQRPRTRAETSKGARVTIVDSRANDSAARPRGKPQTAKSPR